MFDDILETPAAGSVFGRADSGGDDRVHRSFANDALLEIGRAHV